MHNIITKLKLYILLVIFVLSSAIIAPVFATDKDFYSSNDILFYDSEETGCVGNNSSVFISPDSKDNQETVAKYLTSTNFTGNSNKPLNAVQMAAIMGNIEQESGFNPNAVYAPEGKNYSYHGMIQWMTPGRWDNVAEPKTDLINQLNFIKTELDGQPYKNDLSEFWSSSTADDLSKATYAISRNYEVAIDNGGGSKTWTNDSDATKNIQEWANRIKYAKTFYDKFGNLAGSGYTPGPSCGELISGGMTLEEAQKFMDEYKSLEPKDWPSGTKGTIYDINGTDCSGGSLANCVAFSQYFIHRYTTVKTDRIGNGEDVVANLTGTLTSEGVNGTDWGFTYGAHTPKVYSIFSRVGGQYGHTGVVLGIDKDNDKIIIGEASCGESLDKAMAREYSLSTFSGDNYTYAYPDGLLKEVSL